jgi:hypothetical protein
MYYRTETTRGDVYLQKEMRSLKAVLVCKMCFAEFPFNCDTENTYSLLSIGMSMRC